MVRTSFFFSLLVSVLHGINLQLLARLAYSLHESARHEKSSIAHPLKKKMRLKELQKAKKLSSRLQFIDVHTF